MFEKLRKDEDNIFPSDSEDSIINAFCIIDGYELNNATEILRKKGFKSLSNKIDKAMILIESVIKELRKNKIDFDLNL